MIFTGKTQRNRSRRGFTLIETLVLISVSSVLTGIVVTGMASLFRYNRTTNAHAVTQIQLRQLATTLRADVHQANAARWDDASNTLRLEMDTSHTVEYRVSETRWVRIETLRDAKAVTTAFGIDDSFHCDGLPQQLQRGDVLRLSLSNQPSNQVDKPEQTVRTQRYDLVALVGRDARHHSD